VRPGPLVSSGVSSPSLASLVVAAFDRADQAVFISRVADAELIAVNATAAAWLGYSREELLKRGIHGVIEGSPGRTERERQAQLEALRRSPEHRMLSSTRLQRRDGSVFDAEIVTTLFELGDHEYVVSSARNVTERLRVERELQLTHHAVEHAGEAMFRLNASGRILSVNQIAVQRLGYDHDELVGMHITTLDPDYDQHMWDESFAMLKRERLMTVETNHRRKDGTDFPVEITISYLEFAGQPMSCCFARDLSERKRIEQQLLLAERTSALGTLAAGVAHELNNPLTYVRSNLEFLGTRLEDLGPALGGDRNELKEALADVLDGVERVNRIVTDLRTFSRSSDDPIQAVDLSEVVEVAQRVTAHQVQHVATLSRLLPPLPPVVGQESRLVQVLTNLIVNAAQSFDRAAPDRNRIRVSGEHRGDQVILRVGDNGRGIAGEILPRIFDPFFTTKGQRGTGLGLSLCYGIVRSFGGTLDVDSRPGEGTTFSIQLPVAQTTPPAARRPPRLASPRRARVVLIDDDELVLRGVRRLLREHHEVRAFGSGREALAHLRINPQVDVILCDLMMPGLSGADVYHALEAELPQLCPRVWFISGGTFSPQLSEFAALMGDRVLGKPVSRAALLAKITDALGRRRTA